MSINEKQNKRIYNYHKKCVRARYVLEALVPLLEGMGLNNLITVAEQIADKRQQQTREFYNVDNRKDIRG